MNAGLRISARNKIKKQQSKKNPAVAIYRLIDAAAGTWDT
jgi:hypothetical protein